MVNHQSQKNSCKQAFNQRIHQRKIGIRTVFPVGKVKKKPSGQCRGNCSAGQDNQNNIKFNDYLDIACGTGNITVRLAKHFKDIYGVDLSEDMLREAFDKLKSERIKGKIICQDMTELSLNRKFDLITSVLDSTNYITDIEENSEKMTTEISSIGNEMDEMNISIDAATNEINRVNSQSNNVDASFVRNICRKLSNPINIFVVKLKDHVNEVSICWDIIENSYLLLLDSQYAQNADNIEDLHESMTALNTMQTSIFESNKHIEDFIDVLRKCLGMERRLNKAISSLICELEEYLQMTDTISSSVDRILSKGKIVMDSLQKQS